MWRIWRPKFEWPHLCPIILADPIGFVVVMPRAIQPVTFEDICAATGDYYPDVHAEPKPSNWGRLGEKVVILDYGLPDAGDVAERRACYAEKTPL
jgi:hypothetical protein